MQMKWPHLISGTLLKRYKRFLCDVKLKNNQTVTAHCPNTGCMKECYEPGCTVYLSRHNNPARKLKYTLEMTHMETTLVGINTQVPNRLLKESIIAGTVPSLMAYSRVQSEIPYGRNSRIDLLLEKSRERCFVEVKNCTLVTDHTAYFPDAVSSRGLKHLLELERQVQAGDRCVMFYLIQRTDATVFKPADHIDPAYGKTLRRVFNNGVEIMVYDVKIDLTMIELNNPIPYQL
jgi:sugar fermentation stimulation protein A